MALTGGLLCDRVGRRPLFVLSTVGECCTRKVNAYGVDQCLCRDVYLLDASDRMLRIVL